MRLKLLLKAFLQRKAKKETDLLLNFTKFSRKTSYYFFILLHKIESEGTLLNSFSKAGEILISNPLKTLKRGEMEGDIAHRGSGEGGTQTHTHTHTER